MYLLTYNIVGGQGADEGEGGQSEDSHLWIPFGRLVLSHCSSSLFYRPRLDLQRDICACLAEAEESKEPLVVPSGAFRLRDMAT